MSAAPGERGLPPHAVDRLLDVAAERAEGSGADLGRYRLIRELGRGGMGRVYEAEDTQLRRRVALKLMPENVGLSDVMRRRFAREAQAVAKLNHPNIAAVYDATPDYIAMQLVSGCSVLEMPREDRRTIVTVLRDAALAVHYAHESGVVHRDLKPSNLMVEGLGASGSADAAPRVFVLDFGLAKETSIDSSLSMSGSIVGTPAYMSPEQAEGRGDVGVRSDVYALGATLYACLTGEPPFAHRELLELLRKVVDEEPRSPRVEPDLDAIVLKCLAKEPERRYPSALELADDLTRWLRGEPVLAQPPSLAYRLRKFVGRRRALLKAAAATAAGSLAVAAAVLIPIEQSRRAAAEALAFSSRIENTLDDAQVFFLSGDKDEAQRTLAAGAADCERFLAQYDLAHVRYLHGRLLRANGKREAARAQLDRALAMDPAHVGARLERGLLLLSLYGGEKALQALGSPPEPQRAAELEAIRAQAAADIAAVEQRAYATGTTERFVDLLCARGELLRLAGDLDGALVALHRVVDDLQPTHGEANLALSRVYLAKGDEEKARRYSSAALDINLGYAPWYLQRSAAPARASEPPAIAGTPTEIEGLDWVLSDFERDVRRDLRSDLLMTSAGLERLRQAAALAAAGDPDVLAAWTDARQHLDAILRTEPRVAGARVNRGVCLAESETLLLAAGRTAEAVTAQREALADFTEAARRAPELAAAWFDRGLLRLRQAERLAAFGRLPQADEELAAAVRDFEQVSFLRRSQPAVVPSLATAQLHCGRARARRAELLERQSQPERAADLRALAAADLRRALSEAPAGWAGRDACARDLARLDAATADPSRR